MVGDIILLIA